MKHVFFRYSFIGVLFFFGSLFFAVSLPETVLAEGGLSEEALADLVKPSVVRIAEHVTGTARIPAVKVDIRQRLVAVIPDEFTEVPLDEYLTGSGFIIHPDGYIATNAHVVSLETIKTSLAGESALSAIFENALLLSEEEMQAFLDDTGSEKFSKTIVRYIIDHSEFDLKNEVAVLHPDAQEAPIGELIASGFRAEVVAVNENFLDDQRDVALLRINETNLPALSLGTASDFSVGKKVYIFGFPATAEINQKSPGEATFTSGIVSAIKQSSDGNLKIFQTDAKVSQGSSGGPMFNERGDVLGVVTFQTDEFSRTAGDNFAFAVPVDLVNKQALEARVLPEEGLYARNFKAGFTAFMEKHCDTALQLFGEARKTNEAFLVPQYVDPYRVKCQEWQTLGQSRDTYWEEFRDGVSTLSNPLLYIIGGVIFSFGILGATMLWLLRQLRREEREISVLEARLRTDERELRRHEQRVEQPKVLPKHSSLPKNKTALKKI